MAKRRSAAAATPAAADFIRCADYRLEVVNNVPNGIDFLARVIGDDGDTYTLQVRQFSDRTALIQAMLHKIAVLWPAFDFEFKADDANRIVEIR